MEQRVSSGVEGGEASQLPYIENGNRREYGKRPVIDA